LIIPFFTNKKLFFLYRTHVKIKQEVVLLNNLFRFGYDF